MKETWDSSIQFQLYQFKGLIHEVLKKNRPSSQIDQNRHDLIALTSIFAIRVVKLRIQQAEN